MANKTKVTRGQFVSIVDFMRNNEEKIRSFWSRKKLAAFIAKEMKLPVGGSIIDDALETSKIQMEGQAPRAGERTKREATNAILAKAIIVLYDKLNSLILELGKPIEDPPAIIVALADYTKAGSLPNAAIEAAEAAIASAKAAAKAPPPAPPTHLPASPPHVPDPRTIAVANSMAPLPLKK